MEFVKLGRMGTGVLRAAEVAALSLHLTPGEICRLEEAYVPHPFAGCS